MPKSYRRKKKLNKKLNFLEEYREIEKFKL